MKTVSPRKDKYERAGKHIPQGSYCYNVISLSNPADHADGLPRTRTKTCPYYKIRGDWPEMANGYCRLLKAGDSSKLRSASGKPIATMLLFDQVKECGINDDIQTEEETTP